MTVTVIYIVGFVFVFVVVGCFFVSVEIYFVSGNVELRVYSIQSWVCGSEFDVTLVQGKLN